MPKVPNAKGDILDKAGLSAEDARQPSGIQFIRIGRRTISKLNNLLKGDFDEERKMSEPEVQDSAWESADDNNTRKIADREAARISAVSHQDDLW